MISASSLSTNFCSSSFSSLSFQYQWNSLDSLHVFSFLFSSEIVFFWVTIWCSKSWSAVSLSLLKVSKSFLTYLSYRVLTLISLAASFFSSWSLVCLLESSQMSLSRLSREREYSSKSAAFDNQELNPLSLVNISLILCQIEFWGQVFIVAFKLRTKMIQLQSNRLIRLKDELLEIKSLMFKIHVPWLVLSSQLSDNGQFSGNFSKIIHIYKQNSQSRLRFSGFC